MADFPRSHDSSRGRSARWRLDRDWTEELDAWLAGPMWALTIVWMVCLAGGLQDLRHAPTLPVGTDLYWWGMILLWPLYLLELIAHTLLGSPRYHYNLLYVFIPPLRLGGRDHRTWSRIWLPGAGWQPVNRKLVAQVEKALSGPMVGFALLVLPLLAVEFGWRNTVETHPTLSFALQTTSSVIWLAFAIELIVMVSIARRKARYLAQHWIDLLIVLLPMVEVMPALRLAAVGRLSKITKLKYLTNLSRVYRTRGLAMRAFRAFILLDSVQRLLRLNPEKRLAALRDKLEDHYHEIEQIRCEMRELEARLAAEELTDASDKAKTVEYEAVAGE
jgi:voltage-gated potassium channel